MDAKAAENIKEIMEHVENIFKLIDKYEPSRMGSIAFTKLEEAVLWLQVMVQNIPLKEKAEEKKDELIDAA